MSHIWAPTARRPPMKGTADWIPFTPRLSNPRAGLSLHAWHTNCQAKACSRNRCANSRGRRTFREAVAKLGQIVSQTRGVWLHSNALHVFADSNANFFDCLLVFLQNV